MTIEPIEGELLPRTEWTRPRKPRKPPNPLTLALVAGGATLGLMAFAVLASLLTAGTVGYLVYHFVVGWNRGKTKEEVHRPTE